MKELSIEEKAKRYDEAIERANELYDEHERDIALLIFPELRESEDEKIRKALIQIFNVENFENYDIKNEEVIAWLEKQGNKDMGISEATKQKLEDNLNKALEKETAESWNKFFDEQGEQKQDPCKNCKNVKLNCHNFPCIKKRAFEQGKSVLEVINEETVDKVEPKFHEGEWITNGDYTWKIVEVKPLDYVLQSQDGNIVDDTISHVDEQFHSFTIEDTKDGDQCEQKPYGQRQECVDCQFNYAGECKGYCAMKRGEQNAWSEEDKKMSRFIGNAITADDASMYLKSKGIQVIDAHVWLENLKDKVQPKHEWSEDDKGMIEGIIDVFYNNTQSEDRGYIDYANYISWLKSLKERMQFQNTITDEELAQAKKDAYNDTLNKIEYSSGEPTFDDGWSAAIWYLKKRNAQLQSIWKPSDEQMKILNEVLNFAANHESPHWNDYIFGTLNNLIRQLKKL